MMKRFTYLNSLAILTLSVALWVNVCSAQEPEKPADKGFKLPPIKARTTTATVVEVRVKETTQRVRGRDMTHTERSVLLSRGADFGVHVGDTFALLRNEKKIGEVQVSVVYDDVCVGVVSKQMELVKKGDIAVLVTQGRSRPVAKKPNNDARKKRKKAQGVIESLSEDQTRATVTLGSNQGIRVGDELTVYNQDRLPYAQLKVLSVQSASSVARLLSAKIGGLQSLDGDLRVGLVVKFLPRQNLSDLSAEELRQKARALAERARALKAASERLQRESDELMERARQKRLIENGEANSRSEPESARPAKQRPNRTKTGNKSHEGTLYLSRLQIWNQDVTDSAGAEVADIKFGGVGDKMGLRVGDMIYEVDGALVEGAAKLAAVFKKRKDGIQLGVVSEAGTRKLWVNKAK